MFDFDIIIIGAGPAGLTSGIYAGRQNSKTLIIDKGLTGGLGLEVPEMENYPGIANINGMSLIKDTKEQCLKYGVEIHEFEEISSIESVDGGFSISTNKDTYTTSSIIIATGSTHRKLTVPGEEEYLGKGVSYCATCDGMFFKDKDVLVVGGGNTAAQEAIYLSNLGCNVSIVHRRDSLRAQRYLQDILSEKDINIIWNSNVVEIKGDVKVESVILRNNDGSLSEVECDAVFVAIGDIPQNSIAEMLNVELSGEGYIITDKEQRTNVDNVYSAGDITGGVKQWVVACGEGAVASTAAFNDLQKK